MAEINQPTSMSGAQSCPTDLSLQLISLCDSSSDPWAIKDNQSRYLYGNDAYMALLNLKKGFNIKYLTDKQIPHDSAGSALYFEELDRKVQESKQHVFSLNIYPFGTEEIIQPYICEKSPFYSEDGKCMGVILHAKKLQVFSAIQYLNKTLFNVEKKLDLTKDPSLEVNPVSDDINCNLFTDKELEVIFFLQQKKPKPLTSKAIAEILGLSCRTVENKLCSMYRKAKVCTSGEFKEYCKKNGFDKYNQSKSTTLPSDIFISTTNRCSLR
ncbi:PAS domain-containing protein [Candidatus Fukatsuia symbiotica]|uniref:Transcriptional regulator n=1 Tax=Candidatus Fukatsuia symbiotica TaxID=1878942 RepID=A0A2U8I2U6_9GAMM|nr:PAS domain-containing protein [Candidatus Fukatsuia symbiotica]AWK13429.1 transcriptional regulator [Candidatus Fukatsuia symbiotica]MEA9444321.1 PAS domain-containing protein [Candidatus Fukatsuia symbiotica]